tara:strand:- start:469 stop:1116 length:648 start_codon:yes stop_codon:yes gene_type:complete
MASNEHAYLSEQNLHNPKGLSLANNDTLCSKNSDGELEWVRKTFIRKDNITLQGFCTLTNNYQLPAAFNNNNKAPYDISIDYGSATISAATTKNSSAWFRAGGYMARANGVISSARLQITNNNSANDFVVAMVKWSPDVAVITSYPVVLFEKTVNGQSSASKIVSYGLSSTVAGEFVNTAITAGDHIMLMIKGIDVEGEGDLVFAVASFDIGWDS